MIIIIGMVIEVLVVVVVTGADLGEGAVGAHPPSPPEMTCGFLIQLLLCKKKKKLCGLLVLKQSERRVHPILKKILDPPLRDDQ